MHNSTTAEMRAEGLRLRNAAPIWTLLLLAPFIGEVLMGSTRTSVLFVFVPEIMVWGIGALFCRELVRRWRAGSVSLVLLGLALGVAEEFIIQQTSLAPLPFPGAYPDYGRIWGVNLVYLLFMLPYETVWIAVVPVQVTELFFPRQASQPWLHLRGIIAGCVFFVIGGRIAWYGWTQQARPRLHAAPYHPPLTLILFGFVTIAVLIASAYLVRGLGLQIRGDDRRTVPAWLAGVVAFVMGLAWFSLIVQNFIPSPLQPFWIVIAAGTGWAVLALLLFVRWSSRPAWTTVHTYAAASGAVLACIAFCYLTIAHWPAIDRAGELIFQALAVVGFLLLARRLKPRASSADAED